MNVLLFRKDLNLGATIEALQAKNLLQMLAEPNVMATSGQPASFIDGGKIPVPVVQSSLTPGAVTIQYYPYGIQLNFLPEVTPRGTIHLKVTPEVSAPDYSNSVTIAGTTVPGFTSKRVDTEVELEAGQSFVIAGLLDNQTTETLNKIPGLASIPILGKLFQSRAKSKSNSELLVIVTPELVRPIPASQKPPELNYTTSFLEPIATSLCGSRAWTNRARSNSSAEPDHAGGAIDPTTRETESQSPRCKRPIRPLSPSARAWTRRAGLGRGRNGVETPPWGVPNNVSAHHRTGDRKPRADGTGAGRVCPNCHSASLWNTRIPAT